MWPFSSKQVTAERLASDPVTRGEVDEILRRLKLIEREHDDLHAAYRRLRAQRAQEAVGKTPVPVPEATGDDPREPGFDKNALRKKYLSPRREGLEAYAKKGGEGS